jgi:hypothetical protein
MTDDPHSVGDLIDTVVDDLTDLVKAINEAPVGAGERVYFSERLTDILTHVAANVRGVDKMFATDRSEPEPYLRKLVQRRTAFENLISWRTTPIFARPFKSNLGASAQLLPFTQRVAELTRSYSTVWERAILEGLTETTPQVVVAKANLVAAREARQKAESFYRDELLKAMNSFAADLGYTAPVIYAQNFEDCDLEDAQLIRYLESVALESVPPPAWEPGHA